MVTDAVLLALSRSGVDEDACAMLPIRRDSPLWMSGVATSVAVALSPGSRLATLQNVGNTISPRLHVNSTQLSQSGTGSPNATSVATSGPRLVTVMV